MIPLSVLDLVSVREGATISDAMAETAALAKTAEEAGYKRFWIAEHHGMEGLAGGATSVVLAHVGHATSTIRIGAGGIMLPNHNPFVIAEQFGTLDALFPHRIDLGLGRAPGADRRIFQALRKDPMASDSFPQDVVELQARFAGYPPMAVTASPGLGAEVEMWILGSSLYGAQLAAHLGLPYAFASHFAPAQLDQAIEVYRRMFQPSEVLDKPHVMAAMTVIAADTDEEAALLATSMDQSFVRMRTGGTGKLSPPIPDYRDTLDPAAIAMIDSMREAASAIGGPETIRERIGKFIERTQADELIIAGSIWDPEARRRSLKIAMEVVQAL